MVWHERQERFINPYNFIGLDRKCERNIDIDKLLECKDLLTGYIECSLIPKTPIFIPNTTNDDAFKTGVEKHKSYDFYSYDDLKGQDRTNMFSVPVIPGSSLRGVIRSVYEAVTKSCMSSTNDDETLYKRLPDAWNAGIIKYEDSKYMLSKCNRVMLKYKKCYKDRNFIFTKILSNDEIEIFEQAGIIKYLKWKNEYRICDLQDEQIDLRKSRDAYHIDYHCRMLNDNKNYLLQFSQNIRDNGSKEKYISCIDDIYINTQNFYHIDDFKEGQEVWVNCEDTFEKRIGNNTVNLKVVKDIENNKKKCGIKGYIHKGDYIGNKHHVSVFTLQNGIKTELKNDWENQIETILTLYSDEKINRTKKHKKYNEYSNRFQEFINSKEGILPVFYKEINGSIYLSPACITKIVFKNRINDILKINGKFQNCNDKNNLCEACALFGMVGEAKQDNKINAVSTRIRVSDAKIANISSNIGSYFDEIVTLKELASPKISSTEFYLEKPAMEADIWTYDYAFKWDNYKKGEIIRNYKPQIKGRKFYWHHKDFKLSDAITNKKNERNCSIRPLRNDDKIVFKFKVYFDRISKDELKKLIWTLNLGQNDKNNDMPRCHKIGKAKALGLGSIKVLIDSVKVRNIIIKDNMVLYELSEFSDNNYEYDEFIKKTCDNFNEISKITSFRDFGFKICYPIGEDLNASEENQMASHQWFTGNRQINTTATKPKIKNVLPKITDADISLPAMEKTR